jgi:RNA polymerase sigma-32 factor
MTTKTKPKRKQGGPPPERAGSDASGARGQAARERPPGQSRPGKAAQGKVAPGKVARGRDSSEKQPRRRPSTGKPAKAGNGGQKGQRPRAAQRTEADVPATEPDAPEAEAQALPYQPEVLPPEPAGLEPQAVGPTTGEAGEPEETLLPVPVGRDLAHADVLQRYLADIARHPLLNREEEHELAVRFQQARDPKLAWRLVTANLRLVVKIANEYRRAAFNVLDLIQEGNVGLMQAVQKYDPFRGVKLSSYAAWWIRAYIIRYLMDNWRMVKLGTTQAQRKLFFNLRKEQEKLLAQGYEAQPRLLAERLDVSEQDVREMDQRLGNDEFSLDAPLASGQEESRQTYGDRLGDGQQDAESVLGEEELRRVFKEKLAQFGRTLTSDKDRFLFEHRISVPDGVEPLTLQQLGEKYGFTRERARQLEARLTDRLREFLRHELPDFAQLSLRPSGDD